MNSSKKPIYGLSKAETTVVSVHHVAAYILEQTGQISPWRLQRFVYYSQAWKLAWHEYPLFLARIEAWGAGPAMPELYKYHKGIYSLDSWEKGDANKISDVNKEVIDIVISDYSHINNHDFGELVRTDPLWRETYLKYPNRRNSATTIDPEQILIAYSGMAVDDTLQPVKELSFN